jgi:hypothetical protein
MQNEWQSARPRECAALWWEWRWGFSVGCVISRAIVGKTLGKGGACKHAPYSELRTESHATEVENPNIADRRIKKRFSKVNL